jgi:hypothetical protein
MEVKSLIDTMGLPCFDYQQSFAYVTGETRKAVNSALKLMEKEKWSIEKVADVLELSAVEIEALQQALQKQE